MSSEDCLDYCSLTLSYCISSPHCITTSQDGLTALHLAALYGSEQIVRILVQEFRMNPDFADYVSSTPCMDGYTYVD